MKKVLKFLGVGLLVIIVLVVGLIVLSSIAEKNYYKNTKTEKAIDKKYADMGSLEVTSKEYDTSDDLMNKIVIWYPT